MSAAAPNRRPMLTAKVPSEQTGLIGALYVHLEVDAQGRPQRLGISSPGRMTESTMETVLQQVAKAASALLEEVA